MVYQGALRDPRPGDRLEPLGWRRVVHAADRGRGRPGPGDEPATGPRLGSLLRCDPTAEGCVRADPRRMRTTAGRGERAATPRRQADVEPGARDGQRVAIGHASAVPRSRRVTQPPAEGPGTARPSGGCQSCATLRLSCMRTCGAMSTGDMTRWSAPRRTAVGSICRTSTATCGSPPGRRRSRRGAR